MMDLSSVIEPSNKMTIKDFFRGYATSLLIPIVALAGSVSAHGATRTWNGSSSTTWSTPGNWDGGTAPASSIFAQIDDFGFVTAVPEPSTYALAAVGLGLIRRFRR